MAFHDVQLNVDVERGAKGGPRFNTTVIGFGSGFEQRNQEWEFARGEWDLSYGVQTKDDYSTLIEFFVARRGRAHGFRFKDWSDFEALTPQQLGVGDDAETDFQLVKLYTDVASTYTRNITRPVTITVQVFIDDVLQTLTTDYTIEPLGIIRFLTAPAGAEVVTATFEFDLPVRFDIDKMDVQLEWYNAGELPDITVLEIRE